MAAVPHQFVLRCQVSKAAKAEPMKATPMKARSSAAVPHQFVCAMSGLESCEGCADEGQVIMLNILYQHVAVDGFLAQWKSKVWCQAEPRGGKQLPMKAGSLIIVQNKLIKFLDEAKGKSKPKKQSKRASKASVMVETFNFLSGSCFLKHRLRLR